jgi:hypothetical protein
MACGVKEPDFGERGGEMRGVTFEPGIGRKAGMLRGSSSFGCHRKCERAGKKDALRKSWNVVC